MTHTKAESGKLTADWPRQGNHERDETDERKAGSRRVAVAGGASILIWLPQRRQGAEKTVLGAVPADGTFGV